MSSTGGIARLHFAAVELGDELLNAQHHHTARVEAMYQVTIALDVVVARDSILGLAEDGRFEDKIEGLMKPETQTLVSSRTVAGTTLGLRFRRCRADVALDLSRIELRHAVVNARQQILELRAPRLLVRA